LRKSKQPQKRLNQTMAWHIFIANLEASVSTLGA